MDYRKSQLGLYRSNHGLFKKQYYSLIFLLITIFMTGCATVQNEIDLPNQMLDIKPDPGKTKVIFYNGLNPLFLDGSWRIGIKIDGKGLENLHINQYVQVFLELGQYTLGLSHVDVFTFKDEYPFTVTQDPMFVKVYNGIVSTKFEIQATEPEDFSKKYRPVQVTDK